MIYLAIRPCHAPDSDPGSPPIIRSHVTLGEAIGLFSKLSQEGGGAHPVRRIKRNVFVTWSEYLVVPPASRIEQSNSVSHDRGWSYHFVGEEAQEVFKAVVPA